MIFVCPKCKGKLNIGDGGTARCDKGHTYDRSRLGYYNLLLSEKGGVHGDNKEMVLARRAFLAGGFYEPLSSRVAEICSKIMQDDAALLDAGCGEGYYTLAVKKALLESNINARIAVFDISKDAVKEAARKGCADECAVAGAYHMPLADESVDVVLNTFSPLAREEVFRVLKPGGYFVMAIPGEEHLFGLKSKIYDTPYKNEVADTALEGFALCSREEIKYELKLNTCEDIRALFMMTPYAYRTNAEGRERINSLTELETLANFIILTYRKEK